MWFFFLFLLLREGTHLVVLSSVFLNLYTKIVALLRHVIHDSGNTKTAHQTSHWKGISGYCHDNPRCSVPQFSWRMSVGSFLSNVPSVAKATLKKKKNHGVEMRFLSQSPAQMFVNVKPWQTVGRTDQVLDIGSLCLTLFLPNQFICICYNFPCTFQAPDLCCVPIT